MAFAFQRRRGTTTQHATFTGLAGELTVDTTKNTVVVHNGSTAGGFPLSKQRSTFATTSGTTYTLALTDADGVVTSTGASSSTFTVPPSVFVAGDVITVIQTGAGQVTFAQGSGVTIQSTGATATAPKIRAQYAAAQVICTASNTFVIVGDIA
jgi:RNase P/RNase MRP subunit p29